MQPGLRVCELIAAETFALRRAVLRNGDESATVHVSLDDEPTSLHVGVKDERGKVVAVSSYHRSPCAYRPDASRPYQLRWMATDPAFQFQGLGEAVIRDAISRLRTAGADLVWANARDTAVDFYLRIGFIAVPGSGHMNEEIHLPHTVVTLDL